MKRWTFLAIGFLVLGGPVLRYGSAQEEDHHHNHQGPKFTTASKDKEHSHHSGQFVNPQEEEEALIASFRHIKEEFQGKALREEELWAIGILAAADHQECLRKNKDRAYTRREMEVHLAECSL